MDAVMIRGAAEDTGISVYDLEGVLPESDHREHFLRPAFFARIYLVSITLKMDLEARIDWRLNDYGNR